MSVSKIVVRRYGNEPPRLIRKLKRASSVAPKAAYDANYVDPALEAEYERQVEESEGFDVDQNPFRGCGIFSYAFKDKYDYPFDIGLFGRLGLHCYNLHKGTNLKLIGINKHNYEMTGVFVDYITLEAMDTRNNFPCNFQTCVSRDIFAEDSSLKVQTELSRIKVPTRATSLGSDRRWEDKAVDVFYKGKLPSWSSKDEVAASTEKGQLYELQESDLQENGWLHLYAEFAFHVTWIGYEKELKAFLPLKFNKVTIRTKENGQESPQMKLKANNAIFYISFKSNGDPSGMLVEYQAVVRRTMDGIPGHIRLEVDCLAYKSS